MIGRIANQMSAMNGIEGPNFWQNAIMPLECKSLNCVDSILFLASGFSIGTALEVGICSKDGLGMIGETDLHSVFRGFNFMSRTKNAMHSAIK
jgi:hypothetical protein